MKTGKFLSLVCCVIALVAITISLSAFAVTSEEASNDDTTQYYPFIYTDADDFAWARKIIGDCSQCVPGALYVHNLSDKNTWQVLQSPVSMFCSDDEKLYCIVDKQIISTDYLGNNFEVLYTSSFGEISHLECLNEKLFFYNGYAIISFDLRNRTVNLIKSSNTITFLLPLSATEVVWAGEDEKLYLYSTDTEENLFVEDLKLLLDERQAASASSGGIRAIAETIEFPLSEYPSGSYFTNSGSACETHDSSCSYTGGCNCKSYNSSI